jgi:hypothetical protein
MGARKIPRGWEGAATDYTFHYPLERGKEAQPIYSDRLLELIRAQLANLLDLVLLTHDGKEVKVDGFKLLRDRGAVHRIFPAAEESAQPASPPEDREPTSGSRLRRKFSFQDIRNAALYEPRIEFIKKQLESLLTVIELEREGQIVPVDGFRLKNLQDWLVPSGCEPIEVFGYAASRCNCDCLFCYHKGNPPSLALRNLRRPRAEEWEEMKTRLRYFSPPARQALFPTLGCIWEVFAHPRSLEILRRLREKTSRPFRIATSGATLTPDFIAELEKLKPVYLYLSLNSSSPSRRRRLMRDKQPQVAINAPGYLRERGIPYAVVIVPWTLNSREEMLEDLSATAAYAAEQQAHLVEINLPGYSRYFSSHKLFDREEVWSAIVSRARELREELSCPIVVMPTLYEENLWEERKNLPRIIGLVNNSPAARAGLRRGDVLLAVNGLPVHSRPQARDLLHLLQRSEYKQVSLVAQRGDRNIGVTLNLEEYSYPYSPEWDHYLGIIFLGTGLRMSYIEKLRDIIDARRAKHVLFLSSRLVKPTLEQLLAQSHLFDSACLQLDIEIPENFFFGGNIFMGDLLVVQDFVRCINAYVASKGKKPDLVVLPSSPFNLGQWGRDLTGRVYLDIERQTGIPVELLECETIYD